MRGLVGDAIHSRLDKDRIGAFAEYALVRERAAATKPARLDYLQAAAVPLVGLTAWQALIEIARLQAGQKVLIHAGSGGRHLRHPAGQTPWRAGRDHCQRKESRVGEVARRGSGHRL